MKLITKLIRSTRFVISRIIVKRRRGKKNHRKRGLYLRPWYETALAQGDVSYGASRTLLHRSHRPCIRPNSCTIHLEQNSSMHGILFFFLFPIAVRAMMMYIRDPFVSRVEIFKISSSRNRLLRIHTSSSNTYVCDINWSWRNFFNDKNRNILFLWWFHRITYNITEYVRFPVFFFR